MTSPDGGGGGAPALHASFSLPAVAAGCGDQLVLRTTYVSGSSSIFEFSAGMTIP